MSTKRTALSLTKYGAVGIILERLDEHGDDGEVISSRVVMNFRKFNEDPHFGLEDVPTLALLLQELARGVILVHDFDSEKK